MRLFSRKSKVTQSQPKAVSEGAIRKKAYEIWLSRHSKGIDADWNEAKRILEEQTKRQLNGAQKILSQLHQPFIRLEKQVIEPTARWTERADIFKIIEKISPILEAVGVLLIPFVVWAVTQSAQEAKDQQEKAARAQEAVKTYLNQLSSILIEGKLEAKESEKLRTLVRAITLATLRDPNLEGTHKGQIVSYLSEMNLVQGSLRVNPNSKEKVNIPPVISLAGANLSGANLSGANLGGAELSEANLSESDLSEADLSGADLSEANLSGTSLVKANLSGANLGRAELSGANLSESELSEADLRFTNLVRAILIDADLSEVRNLDDFQIKTVFLCKTKLRANSKLNPDRDCEELKKRGFIVD